MTSRYVPPELKLTLIEAIEHSSFKEIENLSCVDIETCSTKQLLWKSFAVQIIDNVFMTMTTGKFLKDVAEKLYSRLLQITDKDIAIFIAKSRYIRSRNITVLGDSSSCVTKLLEFTSCKGKAKFTNSIFTQHENFTPYTILSFFNYFMKNVQCFIMRELTMIIINHNNALLWNP